VCGQLQSSFVLGLSIRHFDFINIYTHSGLAASASPLYSSLPAGFISLLSAFSLLRFPTLRRSWSLACFPFYFLYSLLGESELDGGFMMAGIGNGLVK
jgi:hypothetical protein